MTAAKAGIAGNRAARLDRYGKRCILITLMLILLQLAVLLISAGSLYWANAWAYTGLLTITWLAANIAMLKINPELLNERGRFVKADTKPFDKFFFLSWRIFNLALAIIAGLDAVRFGWTHMPAAWAGLGWGLAIGAHGLAFWAMAVNPHFETTVRIQDDRRHRVCAAGPYRWVRHPGYAGLMAATLAAPFILGSWR